jgi:hypothetical protein
MSERVVLADIERACWQLSGWRVDQRSVDRLLTLVSDYARAEGGAVAAAPLPGLEAATETAERPAAHTAQGQTGDAPAEPVTGPQEGVQRLHITGTLTLVVAQPEQRKRPPRARKSADETEETERMCVKCRRTLALKEFGRHTKGRTGWRTSCRECENTRKRDARRAKRAAERAQAA